MRRKLDSIDRNILIVLQKDGRLSNTQLAERVGLTPAPCLRRVRALEEAGVIQKYAALVDSRALALGVTVFAQVTLDKQVKDQLKDLILEFHGEVQQRKTSPRHWKNIGLSPS